MPERAYRKLRHVAESLVAILLLSFQQIPVVFTWTWPMLLPLAAYLTSMLWVNGEVLPLEIQILFFEQRLMLGRAITIIGFILFLIALFQFVKQRGQLISSGFYSIVRHPQYLSLIIMAFGISVMAKEFGDTEGNLPESWSHLLAFVPGLTSLFKSFPWLVLVFGYVLLALFEEWSLTKEHEQYRQYKKEVAFLFPVPHKSRTEEAILSITIILVMQFTLMLVS
jgi:protein-S-isoprenylcysteine O-methyltransferase Ste14